MENPLDDDRYLSFVRHLLETAKSVADQAGFRLDGLVILVEADHLGVTIASTLDSDDETRRILAEAIARSHNATSRLVE
jgi:hypothetical protein